MRQRLMRYNPLRLLTSDFLAQSLENYTWGYRRDWALLASIMMERDDMLPCVAGKRRKNTAHRDHTITLRTEDPEARTQQAILEEFWDTAQTVDAYDRNNRGQLRLLIEQMGTATDYKNACHHIMWRPQSNSLQATFEYVPPFFFESVWGILQFIPDCVSTFGVPMPLQDWLVTSGDGLMIPCSILYWYKINGFKDWNIFNEKFGIPGILGITRSAPESAAGQAITDAVQRFSRDWAGVVYGHEGDGIQDPLRIIEPTGAATLLPMRELVEYCNQRFAQLYRGSDLGTTSKQNAVGATLQQDESDILTLDDAARISESLNQVELTVLQWHLGPQVRQKAGIQLVVPKHEDLQLILSAIQTLSALGAPFAVNDILTRFGFTLPAPGATLLHPPPPHTTPGANPSPHTHDQAQTFLKQTSHLLDQANQAQRQTLRDQLHTIGQLTDPRTQAQALAQVLQTLPQTLTTNTQARQSWESTLGHALIGQPNPEATLPPEIGFNEGYNPMDHYNDLEPRGRNGRWIKQYDPDMPNTTPDARPGKHYRHANPVEEREIHKEDPRTRNTQILVTDDPEAEIPWTAHDKYTKEPVAKTYTKEYDRFAQATKWNRLKLFHKEYPKIYKQIQADIAAGPGHKDYQKALTLHLMNLTAMRVGGEGDKGKVETFGASSLRMDHIKLDKDGKTLHFDFPGKRGIRQQHSLEDKTLFEWAKKRQRQGKTTLFDHNADGTNDYLHRITKGKFTSHMFRTYHATSLASHLLRQAGGMPKGTNARILLKDRISKIVSAKLGNQFHTSLDSYIHPRIWEFGLPRSEWMPPEDYSSIKRRHKKTLPNTTRADLGSPMPRPQSPEPPAVSHTPPPIPHASEVIPHTPPPIPHPSKMIPRTASTPHSSGIISHTPSAVPHPTVTPHITPTVTRRGRR